ncbi:MAG: VTT domain-containing protein [Sphingomonadaceae bacterium]|nr:VTT domain-containing protein [Sphingomonadaceae bacterium]
MNSYLILFAIVLGVNLMPAFGPPTWSVIVLYGLSFNLALVPMVLTAALAAALGRFLLALGFRLLGGRIKGKTRRNLDAAKAALERHRRGGIIALGLFALSPLPSAQLFEAAGLARVPLLPFTAAFFVGRTISYTIYGATAKGIGESSLGDSFRHALTSPLGIGLQLLTIVLLVAFTQVDWAKRLGGGRR